MVKSTKSGSSADGGRRGLTVRVKTAKGRKVASTRWLQRQLNDPYVEEAKRQGFRSRAAFKLIEIDDKHHLLKPGQTVIDLGAAPGGWSQVAAVRVKAVDGKGKVIAADLTDIEPIAGVDFMVLDIADAGADARVRDMLGGARADLVLSDMAASSNGHRHTDHLRVIALAEAQAPAPTLHLLGGGRDCPSPGCNSQDCACACAPLSKRLLLVSRSR